jgi:nucleoside-diphosphate-sugar epimerase
MTRIALVTGANGFVGSHLCELLLEKGWTVRALVRRSSNLRWLPEDRVEKVYGDVTDQACLGAAVEGADTVFHAAGITRAPNDAGYLRVNAEGTANVARAAAAAPRPPRRIVLVSSLAAGGPSEPRKVLRESDKVRPISLYGRSKLKGEMELARHAAGVPWTVVRPTAVYGPRDRAFLRLAHMAKKGWLVEVSGQIQRISVVHVRDLARAIVAAAESETAVGKRYYIAHPEPTDFIEIGEWMADVLGSRVRVVGIPRWAVPMLALANAGYWFARKRPNPVPLDRIDDLLAASWTCATLEASTDLGFSAEIDTKPGIEDTVRWYLENHWL